MRPTALIFALITLFAHAPAAADELEGNWQPCGIIADAPPHLLMARAVTVWAIFERKGDEHPRQVVVVLCDSTSFLLDLGNAPPKERQALIALAHIAIRSCKERQGLVLEEYIHDPVSA